ncbi:hypothetical protein BKP37_03515 [Anaerobacillus alkalilacustris]|uniref:Lysine decarboxylase n=1 Tax=Anaerobacillus alkalilacustris TaxID=393763 RepID=A0A1S2LYK6_9BACI|nr:aminotransferase class I/II-fold pyridoxal phosphate-dependent enzyme [Anaerobacillus alkalilacustris]OIJ17571.1 hypothetical protein BKP37_03515 [Anaerobacillus alkalilacustris]
MDQKRIPLFEALLAHRKREPLSFHVPGHKNGAVFSEYGAELYRPLLSMDVTELTGLDDLHNPTGVIKQAENLAADWYRSKQCFFLVGGSTVGNLAMIMATCKAGETVLVQRNSHKSILNGLRLAKVHPIFLQPEFDEIAQIPTNLKEAFVLDTINKYPYAKALIITNPNYYGYSMSLESIIKEAHKHKMVVLVDEAHGAHFSHPSNFFPKSALEYGADIVVQSAHKTLPAMTMCSYLHYNSSLISLKKLTYYLQLLQSSSPSYPLMASLDLARHFLASISEKDIEKTIFDIKTFKDDINKIPQLKIVENKLYKTDPLKVTIQSCCELSGYELQQLLEEEGIYTELADPNNILMVMPLLNTINLRRIGEIIKCKIKDYSVIERSTVTHRLFEKKCTSLALSYEDMEDEEEELVPLTKSVGRIISEEITPYPPGVPLLVTGEQIEMEHVKYLYELKEVGAYLQGEDIHKVGVKVFKKR